MKKIWSTWKAIDYYWYVSFFMVSAGLVTFFVIAPGFLPFERIIGIAAGVALFILSMLVSIGRNNPPHRWKD